VIFTVLKQQQILTADLVASSDSTIFVLYSPRPSLPNTKYTSEQIEIICKIVIANPISHSPTRLRLWISPRCLLIVGDLCDNVSFLPGSIYKHCLLHYRGPTKYTQA